ncbi:MAG TPA: GMC oxidoreductase [Anaeromyxobacteraceae bacterium]
MHNPEAIMVSHSNAPGPVIVIGSGPAGATAATVLGDAGVDTVLLEAGFLTSAGWEPRVRVWHIEAPGNSVHYGGTCRMHASPRLGVVDRFCRVHGVPNVAVADSSVFTTGPEKNPVLTAMALAARASDRLAQDLQNGDC